MKNKIKSIFYGLQPDVERVEKNLDRGRKID